jgi:hypothetical protein
MDTAAGAAAAVALDGEAAALEDVALEDDAAAAPLPASGAGGA